MPQHRRRERLPQRLIDRVRASNGSEPFGRAHTIGGAGLRGPRYGLSRPLMPDGERAAWGRPMDVRYSLRDGIITRAEFVRSEPSVPVHIAHFDAETGKRFATVLDRF